VRRERSYQSVQIVGKATDRRQHHDDAVLGVVSGVVDVRSWGMAASELEGHVEMGKVRTPSLGPDGRKGGIMSLTVTDSSAAALTIGFEIDGRLAGDGTVRRRALLNSARVKSAQRGRSWTRSYCEYIEGVGSRGG
jgi:hypothetical protein